MIIENPIASPQRDPWNKGRLIGQKRPLKPKDVWRIRVRFQLKENKRDLAMFNLAIDSKLRGCDLVRPQIDDVCASGRVPEPMVRRLAAGGRWIRTSSTRARSICLSPLFVVPGCLGRVGAP